MGVFRHCLRRELVGVAGLAALAANILSAHTDGEERQYENAAQEQCQGARGSHIPVSYAEAAVATFS
jgi:hypothetical protein